LPGTPITWAEFGRLGRGPHQAERDHERRPRGVERGHTAEEALRRERRGIELDVQRLR